MTILRGGGGGRNEAAQRIGERGWSAIPIPARQKNPGRNGWQHERHSAADIAAALHAGSNVGVLLGEPSGGLVDVDLDCPEALALADDLLPATASVFGRASKPRSHRLYRVVDAVPRTLKLTAEDKRTVLVELRGTGGQTVIPPSIHPSGEAVAWERDGEPAAIKAAPLTLAVRHLAVAALLARHWPRTNGSRHDLALALGGFLLRHGVAGEPARRMVESAARVAGDEEWRERGKDVDDTAEAIAAGRPTTGGATLVDLLGAAVVDGLGRLLPAPLVGGAVTINVEPNTHGPDALPRDEHLTDLGNARRLVRLHGRDLRYCHPWRCWFVWDGTRWVKDGTAEVMRRAKDAVERLYHEAVQKHDEERTRLLQHAMRSQTAAKLRDMVAVAESEPGIPIDPARLDADPWRLNVVNGTIDLRTGALHPHRREDYLTKVAPIVYDPNARSEAWDRFLADATGGDADLAAFLQRAVGYSLTGDTSEEVFFFIHGPQAAGKSTFIEAVKAALGSYATTADFETFLARRDVGHARNDVARLEGARFVSSIEVDEGKRLAEGLVKTLTGGDTVAARFLYSEAREFRPQMKLWLAANDAPKVKDTDAAMWRRILRVPFERTVPAGKRDPQLKKALTTPSVGGPAVLAWAIRGCVAWQRRGLGVPKVIQQATAAYRRDMDPLAGFFRDCCAFAEQSWAKSAALWTAAQEWARDNGEPFTMTRNEFTARLLARGCVADRLNGKSRARVWRGIALLDAETEGDRTTGGTPDHRIQKTSLRAPHMEEFTESAGPASLAVPPPSPCWGGCGAAVDQPGDACSRCREELEREAEAGDGMALIVLGQLRPIPPKAA